VQIARWISVEFWRFSLFLLQIFRVIFGLLRLPPPPHTDVALRFAKQVVVALALGLAHPSPP
jgi:hypothetical protein